MHRAVERELRAMLPGMTYTACHHGQGQQQQIVTRRSVFQATSFTRRISRGRRKTFDFDPKPRARFPTAAVSDPSITRRDFRGAHKQLFGQLGFIPDGGWLSIQRSSAITHQRVPPPPAVCITFRTEVTSDQARQKKFLDAESN